MDDPPDGHAWALSTPQVRELAGVHPSTLDNWAKKDRLVTPSVRGSRGHRSTRLWSIEDAVQVCLIKALRDRGCPLQRIRRAQALLVGRWLETWEGQVLAWDGADLFQLEPAGGTTSLLKRPGQYVMSEPVRFPIAEWRQAAEARAILVVPEEASG